MLLLAPSVPSCREAQCSQDSSLILFGNNIPEDGAGREGNSTEREKGRERDEGPVVLELLDPGTPQVSPVS